MAGQGFALLTPLLWRGDLVELRSVRGDYQQVWDHSRERGGHVRTSALLHLRSVGTLEPAAATLVEPAQRDFSTREALVCIF